MVPVLGGVVPVLGGVGIFFHPALLLVVVVMVMVVAVASSVNRGLVHL